MWGKRWLVLWVGVLAILTLSSTQSHTQSTSSIHDLRYVFFVEQTNTANGNDRDDQRWDAVKAFIEHIASFYWNFAHISVPGRVQISVAIVSFDSTDASPLKFSQGVYNGHWLNLTHSSYETSTRLDQHLDVWKTELDQQKTRESSGSFTNYLKTLEVLHTLLGDPFVDNNSNLSVIYLGTGFACDPDLEISCLHTFNSHINDPTSSEGGRNWTDYGLIPGNNLGFYNLPFGRFSQIRWSQYTPNVTLYPLRENHQNDDPGTLNFQKAVPTLIGLFNRNFQTIVEKLADHNLKVYTTQSNRELTGLRINENNSNYRIPHGLEHLLISGRLDTDTLPISAVETRSTSNIWGYHYPKPEEVALRAQFPDANNLLGNEVVFVYEKPASCHVSRDIRTANEKMPISDAYQYEQVVLSLGCGEYPLSDYSPGTTFEAEVWVEGNYEQTLMFNLASSWELDLPLIKSGEYSVEKFFARDDETTLGVLFQVSDINFQTKPTRLEGHRINNNECGNGSNSIEVYPGDELRFTVALEVPQEHRLERIPHFSAIAWGGSVDGQSIPHIHPTDAQWRWNFVVDVPPFFSYAPNTPVLQPYTFSFNVGNKVVNSNIICHVTVRTFTVRATDFSQPGTFEYSLAYPLNHKGSFLLETDTGAGLTLMLGNRAYYLEYIVQDQPPREIPVNDINIPINRLLDVLANNFSTGDNFTLRYRVYLKNTGRQVFPQDSDFRSIVVAVVD